MVENKKRLTTANGTGDTVEIPHKGMGVTANMQMDFAAVALQYHASGLKVIPGYVNSKGKVSFAEGWGAYREGQTIEQVKSLFSKPCTRICILCTDNMEAIDIDVKADPAGTIDTEFFDLCREDETAANALQKCVQVRTKSGGWHIIYRAANSEGNQKLAHRKEGKEATIETRGNGGLIFAAPSTGYAVQQGNYAEIPTLTDTERNTLISIARLLDEQRSDAPTPEQPNGQTSDGQTSWDAYNDRHTVEAVAEQYGWRVVDKSGDKLYLNRPGAKNPSGNDATILTTLNGNRRFYCHTTSTNYNPQKLYTAFGMYAVEEHRGDIKAATKALLMQGYGSQKRHQNGAKMPPQTVAPSAMDDRATTAPGEKDNSGGENCKSLIVQGNRYFWMSFAEKGGNSKSHPVELSNFVIKPLYHLCHPVNPKRVFEVENVHGEKATVCATAKDIAGGDSFKAIIEGKGAFVASWNGRQFSAIKEVWYTQEKRATEVTALGHIPGKNLFAFSNGIFDCDAGTFHSIDTFGMVEVAAERYFIPALSSINEGGNVFEHERRFFHNTAAKITFEQWSSLFCEAYSEGENGRAGIVFVCAALFRDVIFQGIKSFPIPFLFGPKGTGKSSFLNVLLSLFGQPQQAISLEGASTPKGFNRRLAQFVNAMIVFEEYRNSIPPQLIGMLKSAYDGIGYERAETSNDNRTHTTPVYSAPIVTGNELPTQNSALFSRTLMIEFAKDKFTEQEKGKHNELMDAVKNGLTSATLEILKCRTDFQNQFPAQFRDTLAWLRREATADPQEQSLRLSQKTEQRSLEILAVMLATYRVLERHLKFPFSLAELTATLIEKLKIQTEIMNDNSETAQFFRAFEVLAQQGKILYDRDFKTLDGVLYFYPAGLFAAFRDHIKRTGGTAFDDPTLERYLKRHPAFVPGKDRPTHPIRLTTLRRCLGFHLDKLEITVQTQNE